MIHLDAERVARDEHRDYNPERCDFRWNADHTECDVIPLLWWDDASYAEYQCYDGGPD
jgi:hypothetical protein